MRSPGPHLLLPVPAYTSSPHAWEIRAFRTAIVCPLGSRWPRAVVERDGRLAGVSPYAAALRDGLIQARGLGYRFGRGPADLAGIDLDLHAGEVVAVHGANGAGKTTLLRLLVGVLRPSTGWCERSGLVAHVPQLGEEPPPGVSAGRWLSALSAMRGRPAAVRGAVEWNRLAG